MSMNILIYAKENSDLSSLYQQLEIIPLGLKISGLSDPLEFKEHVNLSSYDMVFIDQSSQCGLELSEFIRINYPQQKLILLTNNPDHIDTLGCTNCKGELNRQMIIKPSNFDNIKSVFFNSCKCEAHKQTKVGFHINKILKEINQRTKKVSYTPEKMRFETHGFNTTGTTLKIINKLEKENIPYKIIDTTSIEVLKK